MALISATRRASSADEVAGLNARVSAGSRLVDRLKQLEPTGRVVLELEPQSGQLPSLLLEDGDRLFVPPLSATVGVFGSVFNGGSYLHTPGRPIQEYLRLAGGPTKGADMTSVLVVRANGSVVSTRQRQGGWFASDTRLEGIVSQAGDTVFVPEEMDKISWVQSLKDWTQVLYNFGLGAAAIKAVFN